MLGVLGYLSFFVFKYPFAFNFEVDQSLSYPLYLSAVLVALVAGGSMLAGHRTAPIGLAALFFFVAGALFLQALSLPYYGLENEYLVTMVAMLSFFLLLRLFLQAPDIPVVLRIVVLFALVEMLIGVVQLVSGDSSDKTTLITGTIGNSGIFACYIAVHIPFVVYLLKKSNGKAGMKYTIAFVYFLTVVLILYFTRSRTAIIAFVGMMTAMGLLEYRRQIKQAFKKWKWPLLGVGAAMIALLIPVMHYLSGMKRLSAMGRLLMVKVATEHLLDHFWFGTGIGRFTWYYPQWQAGYFRDHTNCPLDFYLSAGKTYVLFNEYLQLLEEVGIFGCLLVLYLLYRFFTFKSALYPQLLNYTKLMMFGIMLCGLTSYPLHTNVVVFLIAICAFIAATIRDRREVRNWTVAGMFRFKYVSFFPVVLLLYAATIGVLRNTDVLNWAELRKSDNIDRIEKKDRYHMLHDKFRQDGKFLADYGKFLMKEPGDCQEAKRFFEESKRYFYSYGTFSDEAAACKLMGDYAGVIDNDRFLAAALPNRIVPKYEMANAYFQTGNLKMADSLARLILAMPVKYASEGVENIKASLVKMLDVNAGADVNAIPPELNKRVLVSKKGNRIVFASNRDNYFAPYLLEKVAGKDSFSVIKLPLDEKRDFFPESLSSDGNEISMVGEDVQTSRYDVYIYHLLTRQLQNITRTADIDEAVPIFSPAEKKLAFLSDFKLTLYDCFSGRSEQIVSPLKIRFKGLTWSVNGRNIFLEDDSSNIWKYENTDRKRCEMLWKAPKVLRSPSHMILPDDNDDNSFYFLSDHESQFNQIYKCDGNGNIKLLVSSEEDKYLLRRSAGQGEIYYKVVSDGNLTIRKYQNGRSIDVGPSSGTVFDFFKDSTCSLYVYSDVKNPASLFCEEKGRLKELLSIRSADTMPRPVTFHNKAGMVNFVYRREHSGGSWIVWLHGGPDEQMSARFNVYLDQLIKSGRNVVVLNYPGSTGIGNPYEYRELSAADLLAVQVKTIREDILSIRKAFPDLQRYSIVGVSHGSIAGHAYVHKFREEVEKLVDFSGIARFSPELVSDVPTLYLYGEYDFSLKNQDRIRLIEGDLARGNGERLILKGEGHVINHQADISLVVNEINRFLSSAN